MEPDREAVDVVAVAQAVVQQRAPGEDLDEVLLRVCKQQYGERGATMFEAVRIALATLADQKHVDVETALRQMADGQSTVRVSTVVTRKLTVNGRPVDSLDDLPAELRAQVEKALAGGAGAKVVTNVRVGEQELPAAPAVPSEEFRCGRCGYEAPARFDVCPQCMLPQKRSFWSRLLGR